MADNKMEQVAENLGDKKQSRKGELTIMESRTEKFFESAFFEFGMKREHPDFEEIEEIPNGFVSSCWHNDSYPSVSSEGREIDETKEVLSTRIWIAPKNPAERESSTEKRYTIAVSCCEYAFEYQTDSWKDILACVPKALELEKLIGDMNSFEGFFRYASKAREYGFSTHNVPEEEFDEELYHAICD